MKKKNETEKAFQRRMSIWRHNSFIGQVTRIRTTCIQLATLPTATDATQETAHVIAGLADTLLEQLKVRRK